MVSSSSDENIEYGSSGSEDVNYEFIQNLIDSQAESDENGIKTSTPASKQVRFVQHEFIPWISTTSLYPIAAYSGTPIIGHKLFQQSTLGTSKFSCPPPPEPVKRKATPLFGQDLDHSHPTKPLRTHDSVNQPSQRNGHSTSGTINRFQSFPQPFRRNIGPPQPVPDEIVPHFQSPHRACPWGYIGQSRPVLNVSKAHTPPQPVPRGYVPVSNRSVPQCQLPPQPVPGGQFGPPQANLIGTNPYYQQVPHAVPCNQVELPQAIPSESISHYQSPPRPVPGPPEPIPGGTLSQPQPPPRAFHCVQSERSQPFSNGQNPITPPLSDPGASRTPPDTGASSQDAPVSYATINPIIPLVKLTCAQCYIRRGVTRADCDPTEEHFCSICTEVTPSDGRTTEVFDL